MAIDQAARPSVVEFVTLWRKKVKVFCELRLIDVVDLSVKTNII